MEGQGESVFDSPAVNQGLGAGRTISGADNSQTGSTLF